MWAARNHCPLSIGLANAIFTLPPQNTSAIDRSVLISINDKSNSISWINFMSEIDLDFRRFVRLASASAITSNINQENRLICHRRWSNIEKLKTKTFGREKEKKNNWNWVWNDLLRRYARTNIFYASGQMVALANQMNKYYTIFQVVIVFLFNSINLSLEIYWQKTKKNKCQKQKQISI